jgi:hypothetical protein
MELNATKKEFQTSKNLLKMAMLDQKRKSSLHNQISKQEEVSNLTGSAETPNIDEKNQNISPDVRQDLDDNF